MGNNKERKACPLLSIAAGEQVGCHEDGCAFYVKRKKAGECAIVHLAKGVNKEATYQGGKGENTNG